MHDQLYQKAIVLTAVASMIMFLRLRMITGQSATQPSELNAKSIVSSALDLQKENFGFRLSIASFCKHGVDDLWLMPSGSSSGLN